jgi:hypothetical protein
VELVRGWSVFWPVGRFGASLGDQLAACNCIRAISAARQLAVERE